jgi:hypothetical protein
MKKLSVRGDASRSATRTSVDPSENTSFPIVDRFSRQTRPLRLENQNEETMEIGKKERIKREANGIWNWWGN